MSEFDAVMAGIEEWAWIGWLVLVALFLVIEMFTLEFTFLMLAIGSGTGLVTGALHLPLWGQVIIAAAAAALLILFLRPPLLKRLHRAEDPVRSNLEALIGSNGIVLLQVTAISGQVKLSNGDTWSARTSGGEVLAPGQRVEVLAIEGATVHVRPAQN